MLLSFTVGNFRSFKDKKTLDFRASGITELKENVAKIEREKILRSIVLYGANSSGKSNLIKALSRMKTTLLDSVKLNISDKLVYEPFRLSTKTEEQPTLFEIEFLIEKEYFRYGFEYDADRIIKEWLFTKERKKEVFLFVRELNEIAVSEEHFEEGISWVEKTNPNRLFLSLVAQLGGIVSNNILTWFSDKLRIISGIKHEEYEKISSGFLNHMEGKGMPFVQEYIFKPLKLGFKDIKTVEKDGSFKLETAHSRYDSNGEVIEDILLDCDNCESEGTKKIIHLSFPILKSLFDGETIVIDEFDSKLHPILTQELIQFFHSKKWNSDNPQLLFSTHDTNLLSSNIFRRDQIWFTEKDDMEQTDLYCLTDITLPDGSKIRKDENLEKNYIKGRYGAIPYISQ